MWPSTHSSTHGHSNFAVSFIGYKICTVRSSRTCAARSAVWWSEQSNRSYESDQNPKLRPSAVTHPQRADPWPAYTLTPVIMLRVQGNSHPASRIRDGPANMSTPRAPPPPKTSTRILFNVSTQRHCHSSPRETLASPAVVVHVVLLSTREASCPAQCSRVGHATSRRGDPRARQSCQRHHGLRVRRPALLVGRQRRRRSGSTHAARRHTREERRERALRRH